MKAASRTARMSTTCEKCPLGIALSSNCLKANGKTTVKARPNKR